MAAEGAFPPDDAVRAAVLHRFGHFVTESSIHFSEYNSWFIKPGRPDIIERYHVPLDQYPVWCEEQIAGIMRTNVNVQEMAVEAALTGKREAIYQAAMLDPHTAAELSLDQIVSLADDLIAAHGNLLRAYS